MNVMEYREARDRAEMAFTMLAASIIEVGYEAMRLKSAFDKLMEELRLGGDAE